ncbi:hypothetical protein AABB24_019788 [Solanum stoloniferum]|uniref:PARG catalytic Macro domain-containing protein n=1 Tax=Solanum stoloniferum TaxID=62892 RepID=A0ABD2T6C0_9SOLN
MLDFHKISVTEMRMLTWMCDLTRKKIDIIQHEIGVVTGNWGCGAFGGDPQLKAMLQWIAASQVVHFPAFLYVMYWLMRGTEQLPFFQGINVLTQCFLFNV